MRNIITLISILFIASSVYAETPLIQCNSTNQALQSSSSPPKWNCVTITSGSGTVTSVTDSSGFFFIATPTTTPTFTFANAPANTVFGNNTSGSATPGYQTSINISGTIASAAHTITSSSANAFTVGQNGATNPAFGVDVSTASSATGINIKSMGSGGGVTLNATSTASTESLFIGAKGSGTVQINAGQFKFGNAANISVTSVSSSFSPTATGFGDTRFLFTGAVDTNLPASAEALSGWFNIGQIRQHQTGTITTQRDFRITGATHSFVGASTLTNAAAFSIDGADSGGTNATITNSHALYIPTIALTNVTNGDALNVTAPTGATNNYAGIFSGSVLMSGGSGLEIGAPTGGLEGAGTVNATGLFVNGVAPITTNQTITLTGDTTGSGSTAITTTTGKVNGVSYGTSPSTNTVPVVTGTNAVTYEAVPNVALANSATTVNSQTCTLGSTCTVAAAAGTLTGTTLASGVTASSLTSVGTLANLTVTNPIAGSVTGNAATVSTIAGLIAAGTNVTITGSGTSGSPYTIASSGGGSVSITSATPNLVVSPSPITGTGTVGTTDTINAQTTATTYTILSTDMGKTVTHNASSAVAVTLPVATTTGFGAGVAYTEINYGTSIVTITPTTSTINLKTAILLYPGEMVYIISDGTNYTAYVTRIPVWQIDYQPGLLTAVNATKSTFSKVARATTVDNIEVSASTFSCVTNPTVTLFECGTSPTCASSPVTIGSATITAAGAVVDGTVSNASITAGDYVAWAMTAGTCASIDISATAQVHSNY